MGRSAQPIADKPRRFYAQATTGPRDGGFTVLLDGRGAKTPGGAALVVPSEALAALLAAEWAAQVEVIDYAAMPANRLASTVIDKTVTAAGPLAQEVARYAGSDVLCYRAEGPQALVEAEDAAWTPLLDWARETHEVELTPVEGVIHRAQSPEALARVETLVAAMEPFRQAAVAFATPLFGSAVLALAVERGRLTAEAAFDLSRLDEAFQEERWGVDAEAAARTARLREEVRMLEGWFAALV
jgi:chaperone required for assembly of F1-ATPase